SGIQAFFTAGNVGIGTATPSQILHVSSANNVLARFDSTLTNYARLFLNTATGGDTQISFGVNQSSKWTIGNDATNDSFNIQTGGGAVFSTPKMTILSGGNVGIGTTEPGATLHTKGTALILGDARYTTRLDD